VRLPARARSTRQQDAQPKLLQQPLVQALEQQQSVLVLVLVLVLVQQLEQEQPQQLALL
jgi:hypothetical protein